MKFIRHLPNVFTSLNLVSGCIGIIAIFNYDLYTSAIFIIIGAVFDFLDGFIARLLKVQSALGVQLDSLADIITFGVLPAFLYFKLISGLTDGFYPYFSLILVVASAFRLAKFNIDENQSQHFLGLPTPANAFLSAGLVFIYDANWESFEFIFVNPNLLGVLVLLQSYLLNANMRFFSMKFKSLSWSGNQFQYILAILSIGILIFLLLPGLFFIIITYIILSIIFHFTGKGDVSKIT